MGDVVPSLFTLACQMQCWWSPESTLLVARASWAFWAGTSVGLGPGWVWWRQGHPQARGTAKLQRVSSDDFVREMETQLCRHLSGMVLFFLQISQFSWGVYILCHCCFECCPLGVARWGLRWLQEAALKRNSFVSEILGKIAATSDMKGVFCMMYVEKPITCN